MKKKITMIVFFLLSIFICGKVYAKYNGLSLINRMIYIDAGHGGVDPGAVYKDLKEADMNLIFAKEIGKQLEAEGAIVYQVRTGNYDLSSTNIFRKKSDLSNRIKLINDSKADLYLSLHMNSEITNTWYGPQIFYTNKNDSNKKIAKIIQEKLSLNKLSKRKINLIKNTYMYDRVRIPGVLIEVGFISNYSDRKKIQKEDYQLYFSKIVVDSIKEYFN